MSIRSRLLAALALATALAACKHDVYPDFKPPIVCATEAEITSTAFLIGDAGALTLPEKGDALVDPVLRSLQADVASRVELIGGDRTAVVFLGDNIYPAGLELPGEAGRERGERVLEAQIAAAGEARALFTLGNHDWWQGKSAGGWLRANEQAEFLAKRGPRVSIHPGATCAGPEVVDVGDRMRFVFVDLWAARYQMDHPDGRQDHCALRAGEGRVIQRLQEIFAESVGRELILVTHAPMMTSGPHGGYFPWREHIFPLRVFHRDLWIPLPVIGSLFPLARTMGVTDTDMMSSNYRRYIDMTREIFRPGRPSLVAAGHEHSLQVHIDPTGVMHAVSGAGSAKKVDYVRTMNSDLMSLAAPGYMRLEGYADDRFRLTVLALDDDAKRHFVYSTCVP